MQPFGQRIRELREYRDISLRELARSLDVSAAFISDVELGRRYPSDNLLARLAKKLQTTMEDLRSHDTRAPLEDLRRLAASNPVYGVALRRLVDKKVDPDDLLEFVNRKHRQDKP